MLRSNYVKLQDKTQSTYFCFDEISVFVTGGKKKRGITFQHDLLFSAKRPICFVRQISAPK
jgi:hypothetical protein